jgi:hypothetical protein
MTVNKNCALTESGFLEFDEFVQLAAKFMNEEDEEEMEKELREAFRLYDKEGECVQIYLLEPTVVSLRYPEIEILWANFLSATRRQPLNTNIL